MMFFRGESPPPCDVDMGSSTRWRLVYEVYQYFLPEGDLSEQSLISNMEKVANVQNVQDNSRKVCQISLCATLPLCCLLQLLSCIAVNVFYSISFVIWCIFYLRLVHLGVNVLYKAIALGS